MIHDLETVLKPKIDNHSLFFAKQKTVSSKF